MKQNERILVYVVTGFLALILVVAVFFGNEGTKFAQGAPVTEPRGQAVDESAKPESGGVVDASAAGLQGLREILGDQPVAAAPPTPQPKSAPVAEQPLVAAPPRPVTTSDLVAQNLGASRRERTVRFVRARAGDSLEMLVRRWCGARDPWLEEAQSLNEDLAVLRVGQEVAVPWVEDEVVLAAFEARQPKPVAAPVAADGGGAAPAQPTADGAGSGLPPFVKEVRETVSRETAAKAPAIATESLQNPGVKDAGQAGTAAGSTRYTVKSGDSLWKIANRTYGRANVEQMVAEIQRLNPDLGDTLKVGQKLVLPTATK